MRYFSCLAPKRIKTQQTTHFGFEMQEIARKNLPSSSNDIFLLQNAAWFFLDPCCLLDPMYEWHNLCPLHI